ncbi:MAG: response regulator [Tolypothrix sp. T3-bin4]|nr:response regulator [Tolypothrix sp. T3-bin4]
MRAVASAPGAGEEKIVIQKNKGCSLVVVDDNPWENQFTEMILRDIPDVAGYRFFAVGWQAFNYLDVCRAGGTFPDVILVDLLMEDMTGFAWIEHFEREFWPAFPGCLVFVYSHSALESDRVRASGYSSVRAFLPKPLTPATFDARIRPLLP